MKEAAHLQIQNLAVDLAEFHLREINLNVHTGEYFVILGPTGAGKTVLLETIAGLFQPRLGSILLRGEDITEFPPERRGISFVYQDYVLFPHLNVAENIAFGLKIRDLRGFQRLNLGGLFKKKNAVIEQQVNEISELLRVDHLLHRDPKTLSGGEQQRAALARALVVKPQVMLLDEPLSALDPETREDLQRELARIHKELGTTILHVTHDFEEAVALGDRIAVMNEGRIVQVGSPQDIFRRPASEFVARFVGSRNIFSGRVEDAAQGSHKEFALDGLRFAVVTALTGPAHASLRPEDIILSQESLRSSARNCFPGVVAEVADRGAFIYVTVRVASSPHPSPLPEGEGTASSPHFICTITHRSREEMNLREGSEVYVAFKASAVHVF